MVCAWLAAIAHRFNTPRACAIASKLAALVACHPEWVKRGTTDEKLIQRLGASRRPSDCTAYSVRHKKCRELKASMVKPLVGLLEEIGLDNERAQAVCYAILRVLSDSPLDRPSPEEVVAFMKEVQAAAAANL